MRLAKSFHSEEPVAFERPTLAQPMLYANTAPFKGGMVAWPCSNSSIAVKEYKSGVSRSFVIWRESCFSKLGSELQDLVGIPTRKR